MTCGSIIHSIWTSSFEKYSFFDTASYLRSWLHYIMYQIFFLAIIFCIFCISQFKYLLHTVNLLIQFLLYRCSGPYLWFFVYWTPLFLFPISFFVFCQIGYAFSNDWKICEEPVFSLHSFINIKPIVLEWITHKNIMQMQNSADTGTTHVLRYLFTMMQANWPDTIFLSQGYWFVMQKT